MSSMRKQGSTLLWQLRPSFTKTLRKAALMGLALGLGAAPAVPQGPVDEARHELRNFDARVKFNVGFQVPLDQRSALETMRSSIPDLKSDFDLTTGATRSLSSHTGYLTTPRFDKAPAAIAHDFVLASADLLGLAASDMDDLEVTDLVPSRVTGATHVYFRQRHLGLAVYNAQLQVNVNREGRILSINNAFLPEVALAVNQTEPALAAADAVARAAEQLAAGKVERVEVLRREEGAERVTLMAAPGISRQPIEARLRWLPVRRGVARLVWNFQIETPDGQHLYDFTVDAEDGRVWTRFDWVNSASYRVYEQPVESPNHTAPLPPADARSVALDPADPVASSLGWHDTGTTAYTIMRGNNAHAYEDRDANNSPPASEPSCGGTLDCDFAINLSGDPSTYIPAAVANLFYWNNVVHDVQYQYGFDEPAGNFQVNNCGNGGLAGDDVRAEAQDGSGNCNANFSTPTDGGRPRMQMYTCTNTNPAADGDLDNGVVVHEYGHGISIRQVGGPGNSSCLNNNQQPGEGWSDWFALAYTAEVGDQGTDKRGIGTYLFGQPPDGDGIRPQPYSTDPAINSYTYESISGLSIPHGVGSVWAQAIWEVYWALVGQYGFDPDLYNAAAGAGNHRAMLYVNEGLKNTACSPTFTDTRDGIIQAAVDNFGGADVCLLWQSFAAFGLGTDAVSGGSNSTNPTNGFQVPPECACQPQPIADAGPDEQICLGESAILGTPAQSGHSYSWSPGGQSTAQITVSPAATTTYTVTATTTCGSAQDSVTVTVDDGSGGGLSEDFEGGAGSWTATGLWHLTVNSACASPGYSSPVNAFYYGQDSTCDYNAGTNSGALTSPPISGITASSTLSFDYYRVVESFSGGSYDRTEVDIVTAGGSTTVFALDSTDPSTAAWTNSGAISLASFAGQTIQVRFRFDTVDNVANNFTGWLIDDVVVTAESVCTPGNTPPTVTITAPPDGSAFAEGTLISFSGTANDAEEGDLTASLGWSSSLDGAIGTGGSFSRILSVGTHTVTASATDSGGLTGSDSIVVTVNPNTAPAVTISSPADGSSFVEGSSVTFTGSATDAEEGDLTAGLSWSSSLDGTIGSGGSFSISTLSLGSHTVTASVTDSGGLSGQDSIAITIEAAGGGGTIDWNSTPTVAYSNQDGSGTITVEDGGATFFMQGNRWRRTVETFTITPLTTLEFDFQSTSQGEIHGIGFDEDDTLSNDIRIFQLYGTQNWTSADHTYDDYGTPGVFKTYRIPVGAFYSGSGFRLVLVNDKDSGTLNNTSRFRNVRVFEADPGAPLDFNVVATEAYSNQDGSGTIAVQDGGLTFFMEGNRWRRTLQSFTVNAETVVAFDFMSTSQGEIHGVGFDENQTLGDAQRIFRIWGTQNWSGDINWIQTYTSVGSFQTFVIPVGRFYSGAGFRLVLVNDKDSGTLNNNSRYRNVRIYRLDQQ